ncbi:hypothetical protein DNTS_019038, partial [Danionella cerebrum]
ELLGEWKRVFETDKVVIGGDFNLVPDKWIDRYPPKGQSHNYEDIITKFIANWDLIDFWRSNNSDSRQYTWFNSANNGQCSRLDYWLLSTNLISKVSRITAVPLVSKFMGQLDHFSSQLPKNFKKKGGAAAPKITGILSILD